MKSINKLQDYIAIGELSEMTGIGVHTLRVWEKRYGAPHSQRLPSGHRRYPKEEVPRLILNKLLVFLSKLTIEE